MDPAIFQSTIERIVGAGDFEALADYLADDVEFKPIGDQVWASDISYIAMRRGFVYRAVIIDWATHCRDFTEETGNLS
jgi:hypothetical protein